LTVLTALSSACFRFGSCSSLSCRLECGDEIADHALRGRPGAKFAPCFPGHVAWAVEGTGHYGAGLTRFLRDRGETVLEAGRHARTERRLRGKDDHSTRSAPLAQASPLRR
jgi:transposase